MVDTLRRTDDARIGDLILVRGVGLGKARLVTAYRDVRHGLVLLMAIDFAGAVGQLVRLGFSPDNAERQVRAQLRVPRPDPERSQGGSNALEKQIEHEGDVMMQKLGFEVIRFSHPGKTRQTPGIPDRRYYRRPRADSPTLSVWVEYKSAGGRQRPGQKLFQELVEACGEFYVLGGLDELTAWLRTTL